MRDSRYKEIKLEHIKELTATLSYLYAPESYFKWNEWERGKNGIIVEFEEEGKSYNATYLPDYAIQEATNKIGAVDKLIIKSGYKGSVESVRDKIKLTRYLAD